MQKNPFNKWPLILLPVGTVLFAGYLVWWFFLREKDDIPNAGNEPMNPSPLTGQTGIAEEEENMTSGIDVSHRNGVIEWDKVAASGVRFAFIKATQGVSFIDPMFASNVQGAQSAGILAFPYQFWNPGDNPQGQLNNLLNQLEGLTVKRVGIDLEENGLNYMLAPSDNDGSRLRVLVDGLTSQGYTVDLYMTPTFKAKWYPQADWMDILGKWIAYWSDEPPSTPFEFWQYTAHGTVEGIQGDVDMDYYNGGSLS